jgi:prevent-host-death family protein
MTTQLEITDVKDRFAELLARARAGEEIVLADGGTPVVKITQAESSTAEAAPVPDWKAAIMQAAGMWKDRDDIPELIEQLRKEWNRVEPPDEPL